MSFTEQNVMRFEAPGLPLSVRLRFWQLTSTPPLTGKYRLPLNWMLEFELVPRVRLYPGINTVAVAGVIIDIVVETVTLGMGTLPQQTQPVITQDSVLEGLCMLYKQTTRLLAADTTIKLTLRYMIGDQLVQLQFWTVLGCSPPQENWLDAISGIRPSIQSGKARQKILLPDTLWLRANVIVQLLSAPTTLFEVTMDIPETEPPTQDCPILNLGDMLTIKLCSDMYSSCLLPIILIRTRQTPSKLGFLTTHENSFPLEVFLLKWSWLCVLMHAQSTSAKLNSVGKVRLKDRLDVWTKVLYGSWVSCMCVIALDKLVLATMTHRL